MIFYVFHQMRLSARTDGAQQENGKGNATHLRLPPSYISALFLFWLPSNEGELVHQRLGYPVAVFFNEPFHLFLRHANRRRHMHIAILHDTHRQPPGSPVCHLYGHINPIL